jgi:SAM-dependent methyltransferase
MDDQIRSRWDQWFRDEKSYQFDLIYTAWLDRYSDIFRELKTPLSLDLGCGRGFDTRFLIGRGLTTISADFSLGALYSTRKTVSSANLLQLDLRERIPFQDKTFGLIVANLSLHYFSALVTSQIIQDLHRIMANDGWLIARVNSTSDHGFQSVKDKVRMRIEEDYYLYRGIPRRYFRESSIQQFFSNGWKIHNIEEKNLLRYEKPKAQWEFTAQRTSIIP